MFIESDSFRAFLDSGLLKDEASERLYNLVRSHEVASRRDGAKIAHRARAVYHEPSLSVRALAYFSKSLSRSFVSTAMSDRYGLMCSAFQRSRVRKRSANRMGGSVGSSAQGKQDINVVEEENVKGAHR